jgi:paraquat-inducible protein B
VVPSLVPDLEAKITNIVAKLDKLPYEEIGDDLKKALASLDQMLKAADKAVKHLDAEVTPGLKTTLDGVHGALATADRVLKNTDATLVGKDAPVPQELSTALQELARAARALRILADYLERHPESLIRGKTGGK